MKSEIVMGDRRLQITRVFEAPRPLVFAWWTKAEKLRQWSGCKEAVACEIEMDFRVGGAFTQKMQLAVHGTTCEFSFRGVYLEIARPERIVYQAIFGDVTTQVTVEFHETARGTKVVLTHEGFPDPFFSQNVSQGTAESFDKLDALVAQEAVAAQ